MLTLGEKVGLRASRWVTTWFINLTFSFLMTLFSCSRHESYFANINRSLSFSKALSGLEINKRKSSIFGIICCPSKIALWVVAVGVRLVSSLLLI